MPVHATTVVRRLKNGWSLEAALNTPALNQPADLRGRKFGSLVAVDQAGHRDIKPGVRHVLWLCRCDCGRVTKVTANNLRNASTKTCGCRLDRLKREGLTHGHVRGGRATKTYESWVAMLGRCYNPNGPKYRYYGGRGISVCEQWRNSFEVFLRDMGERPKALTLDRIDPCGNYEPANCRWATRREQNLNTRRSIAKRAAK
jgi:hypothetical protein